MQRAGRQPVAGAGDLATTASASAISRGVERDRLDRATRLPLDLTALLARRAGAAVRAAASISASTSASSARWSSEISQTPAPR